MVFNGISRWGSLVKVGPSSKQQPKKKLFVISIKTGKITAPVPSLCIAELAVAEYKPGKENIKSHCEPVNPGASVLKNASTRSLAKHHIQKIGLKEARGFLDVWREVAIFVGSRCTTKWRPVVIAYGADVEVSLLRSELRRIGEAIPDWDFVCAMRAAEEVWPGESVKLNDWVTKLGLGDDHLKRPVPSITLLCKILDELNVAMVGKGVKKQALGKPLQDLLFEGAKSFELFGDMKSIPSAEMPSSGHMESVQGSPQGSSPSTTPLVPPDSRLQGRDVISLPVMPPVHLRILPKPSPLLPSKSRRVPCPASINPPAVGVSNSSVGHHGPSAVPVAQPFPVPKNSPAGGVSDSSATRSGPAAVPVAQTFPVHENSPVGGVSNSFERRSDPTTAPVAQPLPVPESNPMAGVSDSSAMQSGPTAASVVQPLLVSENRAVAGMTDDSTTQSGPTAAPVAQPLQVPGNSQAGEVSDFPSGQSVPNAATVDQPRVVPEFASVQNLSAASDAGYLVPTSPQRTRPAPWSGNDSPTMYYFVAGASVFHIREDCQGLQKAHKRNVMTCTSREAIPDGRRLCGYTCQNGLASPEAPSITSDKSSKGSPRGIMDLVGSNDIVYYIDGSKVYHTRKCNGLKKTKKPVKQGSRDSISRERGLCRFCQFSNGR